MDEKTLSETNLSEIIDIPMGGKKNVIMDSQILTALMSCPRMADFRFNHNLMSIGGKGNSLEVGSIVHKFLEVYYQSQINKISKTQAAGFAFAAAELYIQGCRYCTDFEPTSETLKPSCGHQVNEYPGVFNTPKESEGYIIGWHYALDSCQQYLERWRNDSWTPLEVERVRGGILYQDDEIRVMWKAKIDTLMNTGEVNEPMDHKTMKQNRPNLSLNNQFMGQCIVTGARKLWINKFGFQKTLKPEEKFIRVSIPYSAERLFEWQSETLPFYARLLLMYSETGHFPPNYSSCETKYGMCSYVPVCESEQSQRETELKRLFKVGPVWNPTNDDTVGD
jgi:hypothetical protein